MSKIIALQGVPASGKTTWANEFVKNKKDWVIVSRDAIREASGNYWVPEREDYITKVEFSQIKTALEENLNVIIDDTNLNPKTIEKLKNLAEECKVEIEFKLFKISYEEALARDEERRKKGKRAVGKQTLRSFFKRYFPEDLCKLVDDRKIIDFDFKKSICIVCDIDGTVALRTGRSPFDYSKVQEDKFDFRMLYLLSLLKDSAIRIIFVSGREGTEQCIKDTTEWLTRHIGTKELNNWEIFFRKEGDHRNDAIVKKEIYEEHIAPKYNVIAAFDDRDRVVNMWRDLGILCCQVYYGDF